MSRAFLFDIDNTLLYTGGAGSFAMNSVFREMFGIEDGFSKVEFSGRTDLFIVSEGLRQHGVDGDIQRHVGRFVERYYELLSGALNDREGSLMPGFPELLDALSGDAKLGLATGNFRKAADIKLRHYGIGSFFAGGGFGEVSVDRAEVVKAAVENVADGRAPEDVFVIGDTPHDIRAALANGVKAVGVATGSYSVDELKSSGADLVFKDFESYETVAATLLR
ncbi:MAG: HAD family hydrolase [Dehalococcoidia bacterium]